MTDLITGATGVQVGVLVVVAVVATVAVVGLVRGERGRRTATRDTELVGKTCVVREEADGCKRAEVTDAEGATRVIQVRPAAEVRPDATPLRSGSSALIYDYDNTGGYFVVAPVDAEAPRR